MQHFFLLAIALCAIVGTTRLTVTPLHGARLTQPLASFSNQSLNSNPLSFVFLTPTASNSIALSTHIAQLTAIDTGNNETILFVNASFRLKNEATLPAATTVRLSSLVSGSLPADLVVTIDNQPAAGLYEQEGGGQALDLTLGAEGVTEVAMTYSLRLPPSRLMSIRYPLALLARWQQRISTSILIELPETVAPQSVVQITPSDWIYPSSVHKGYALRWLFDGSPSEQPFSVLYVQSTVWQQIEQVRSELANGDISKTLSLGDLYLSLMAEATDSLRDSFYAQALAAFNEGIQRSTDPTFSAALQARLARLYRSQIVTSNGTINYDYAQLAVTAVDTALKQLPANDGQRIELEQWRADALSVLLNEAQRTNDWKSAGAILDQLNQFAQTSGNNKFVADARRRLIVQQALQLLEDGNREAAIALAGRELGDSELRAPDELTSLFESWQVTVTISTAGTLMDWIGIPAADHVEAAKSGLQELITAWKRHSRTQGYGFSLEELPRESFIGETTSGATTSGDTVTSLQPLHLKIIIPQGETGLPLAEATTLRTDWALFRTLFAQTVPQIEQHPQLYQQRISIRLPLDLRTVAEQWNIMADNLEKRALAFEAQTDTTSTATATGDEAILRARIQLSNYRAAANLWSRMVRNSSVSLILTTNALDQPVSDASDMAASKSWLITALSPPQTIVLDTFTVNWGRVLATIAGALFVLFLTSGALWWLL